MTDDRDTLTKTPRRLNGYMDGAFVKAGGEEIPVIDPATEQTVGVLFESSTDDVDRAVSSARHAFDKGPWGRTTVAERQT
ncbi:aldehyde dehydrogenase family protein, partial [Klebsiella pneumoniae]